MITGEKKYSQQFEEVLIRHFFQDERDGVFLDVGCAFPCRLSTTCYLERHLGWSGIAVDANPGRPDNWKKRRPRSTLCRYIVSDRSEPNGAFYAHGFLGSVKQERSFMGRTIKGKLITLPTITLNDLLDEHGVTRVDFISMDIEGSEVRALAGFDIERFRPRLLCLERTKETIHDMVAYFHAHGYRIIEEFLAYDRVNLYYTPKTPN